jgi:hypothetical protein
VSCCCARTLRRSRRRATQSGSASATAANSAPASWSGPTAPSPRCAARPASIRAAGTMISALSSRISGLRCRTARPPSSDSSTPGRWHCCRSRTDESRSSGRRCRNAPRSWCAAPRASSRSA